MFITLLMVNFVVTFAVCAIVARFFSTPLNEILRRLISENIYVAWSKYIVFAIYVVGISGGIRIWELEKYVGPPLGGEGAATLTLNRWVLEIYRTIIGTLQSIAWVLLWVFIIALIAFAIIKSRELKKQAQG